MVHGMPSLNSARAFGSARFSCKEILPLHLVAAAKWYHVHIILVLLLLLLLLLLLSQEASARLCGRRDLLVHGNEVGELVLRRAVPEAACLGLRGHLRDVKAIGCCWSEVRSEGR